jgi:hypothetical protein
LYWAFVNASIFTITLALAMIVYPCGMGSVWCWFIFVTGPILVVADRGRNWVRNRQTSLPSDSVTVPRPIQWRRSTI